MDKKKRGWIIALIVALAILLPLAGIGAVAVARYVRWRIIPDKSDFSAQSVSLYYFEDGSWIPLDGPLLSDGVERSEIYWD